MRVELDGRIVRLAGLQLDHHERRLRGRKVLAQSNRAIPRLRMREADRSRAVRCVRDGGSQRSHFLDTPRGGQLDARSTCLEQPVDEPAIDLRDPDDGGEIDGGGVTNEAQDVRFRELRVLVVDDAEVERLRANLDRFERWKLDERAYEAAVPQPPPQA